MRVPSLLPNASTSKGVREETGHPPPSLFWYNCIIHSPMTNPQSETIESRLVFLKKRLKTAAEKSGRSENKITLVAVIKGVPAPVVNKAIELGLKDFGENRIQEALAKRQELKVSGGQGIRFHMIGHIQTNKAKKAVEFFDMIQSVDRPELAAILDRAAAERGKIQRCFVEVKISPEPTKTGIPLNEAPGFIGNFKRYNHLQLEGLMTIPPFGLRAEETFKYFSEFKSFFDSQREFLNEKPVLSMGMTDDFEIAIEAGATMVRIGRGLFGERELGTI